jgi:hypothetical protein
MKVHSYYYGPREGNGGLDFRASPELTKTIDEDTIRELYSQDTRHPKQFSELYDTPKGPAIGLTRIIQVINHDGRQTTVNRSTFVLLSDFVNEVLVPLLDEQQSFPVETIKLKLHREG